MTDVLLVEDEYLIAEFVKEALVAAGCSVVTAHDAVEAFAALAPERRSFSAIVTDLDLGAGPDGIALVRRARELNPTIRVAYMTGHLERLGAAGENELLMVKPFDPDELARRITALEAAGAPGLSSPSPEAESRA